MCVCGKRDVDKDSSENASGDYGCSKHAVQSQATDSYITNGGFAFEVEEFAIQ